MKKYILIFLACIGIGTAFNSCTKECTNDCLNGGTCVSGDCDCAPGFTGINCENAVGLKITSVSVTSIPFKDANGNYWDAENGPDVFFEIKDRDGNRLYSGASDIQRDVFPGDLPVVFRFSTTYRISDLGQRINFLVYDQDDFPANKDFIGLIAFQFNDYLDGSDAYPTQVEKTVGELTIRLNLEWK